MNKDLFINPNTGEEVVASTDLSWVWFLLFGQLHTIFNGRVGQGLIHILIVIMTFGVAQFYYLFMVRTVARNYYANNGYILKSKYDEDRTKEEKFDKVIQAAMMK